MKIQFTILFAILLIADRVYADEPMEIKCTPLGGGQTIQFRFERDHVDDGIAFVRVPPSSRWRYGSISTLGTELLFAWGTDFKSQAHLGLDGNGRVYDFSGAAKGEKREAQLVLKCTQPVALDPAEWRRVMDAWAAEIAGGPKPTQ